MKIKIVQFQNFWNETEIYLFASNLAFHTLLQILLLAFMPLPFYSQLSLHDGQVYYQLSENLLPDFPQFPLNWHKRILLPLLVAIFSPWNRQVGFLAINIIAASLSVVYFYKISSQYSSHPLRLAVVYSLLPYLVFSTHHGLAEPLMMLLVTAGFYYFLRKEDTKGILCHALAILAKEIAVVPLLAIMVVMVVRKEYRRALLYWSALIPVLGFWLFYGWRWGDILWYLRNSQMSLIPGPWYIAQTLIHPLQSSANPIVALVYNTFNQVLSIGLLVVTALGAFLLRSRNGQLALYCALLIFPLWFLERDVYTLNSNLGRQFLMASLTLIGLDIFLRGTGLRTYLLILGLLAGMLLLSFLWILIYAKFFVFHKFF